MSLKNSNSTDIYDLNTRIIKDTLDFLVIPLTHLANACFEEGIFPDVFKVTRVVPIFKKGNVEEIDNYRPISIIPIFGKILEILIKTRLDNFLDKYSLLNNSQYGFRRNRSTIQAVHSVVRDVVGGLEEGRHTAVTLCDLSKAFDCVSHDTLLEKMTYYGIRGIPLLLFESYLRNRQQCVNLNNSVSDFEFIKYGVPQGSVLGPLLFIIYINDLYYHLLPEKCVFFADDTSLICSEKNKVNLSLTIKNMERKAESWFSSNNLKLNKEKTQQITFSGTAPHVGVSVKLLGITLDSSLKWTCHIDLLCKKLSSHIFLLRQLKNILSNNMLLIAYYSTYHTFLSYGIILWGNSAVAIRVFKLQKKAVRIIANVGFRDHCKPLFKKYGIMPLPTLYIYYSLLEIHKNASTFNKNCDIHKYQTRSSNLLRAPKHRLQRSVNNTLDLNLYNKLPPKLKTLNNQQFKCNVKSIMLMNCYYSIQEYMDTPLM